MLLIANTDPNPLGTKETRISNCEAYAALAGDKSFGAMVKYTDGQCRVLGLKVDLATITDPDFVAHCQFCYGCFRPDPGTPRSSGWAAANPDRPKSRAWRRRSRPPKKSV